MVVRRPNPRDGRGTLAEITGRGREVAERATKDLMAARFGMGGYGTGELEQVFTLLRGLRLAAGDFVPEPDGDGQPGPVTSWMQPRRAARAPETRPQLGSRWPGQGCRGSGRACSRAGRGGLPGAAAVIGEPDGVLRTGRPGRPRPARGGHPHVGEAARRRGPAGRRQVAPPSAETSMPWLVASTRVPDGLPDRKEAVPRPGRCRRAARSARRPARHRRSCAAGRPLAARCTAGPARRARWRQQGARRLAAGLGRARAGRARAPRLAVPVTGCHAAPVGGPPNRIPSGVSRYAVVSGQHQRGGAVGAAEAEARCGPAPVSTCRCPRRLE